MRRIGFIFGVHCHQPVGNFNFVIEEAYKKSYKPFLEAVSKFPLIKIAFHISGPLLEWIEDKHREYIDMLRGLVGEGRAEVIGSGYYEPVLASLPKEDRCEQILSFALHLEKTFGVRPRGLWLTERVWESEIIDDLIECGIKYVFVDDYHFISAGFNPEELHGYFLTESSGRTLAVFPIDERLRYLTPFQPEDETVNYLRGIVAEDGQSTGIIFDDCEKFGSWPGTHKWVYEEGWIHRFFEKLSLSSDITWFLPGDYVEEFPPRGMAYLPTASYFEMGQWSLPSESALEFGRLVRELRSRGDWLRLRSFMRGGIWKNFFVKYPEANYMHKKMIHVSRKVRGMPEGDRKGLAKKFLLRS